MADVFVQFFTFAIIDSSAVLVIVVYVDIFASLKLKDPEI